MRGRFHRARAGLRRFGDPEHRKAYVSSWHTVKRSARHSGTGAGRGTGSQAQTEGNQRTYRIVEVGPNNEALLPAT